MSKRSDMKVDIATDRLCVCCFKVSWLSKVTPTVLIVSVIGIVELAMHPLSQIPGYATAL